MTTLYALKPGFQRRLRPICRGLAASGVTANQVTIAGAVISVSTGITLSWWSAHPAIFWLLPLVLLVRMALNALDGMLAREFGQASKLGAYLNELADVVSDTALILPFVFVAPFGIWGVMAFAITAILAELAGVLGQATGGIRAYDGPFGKSDRALALALLAAIVASGISLPVAPEWLFPAMALLALVTMVNRVRSGLRPSATNP
ncbi:CDP-alcohol phosphatidyltransferase family protein [Mesorhizobium sp. ZC-5]|uniref:CDP-alcohol phosphatidyltransferase family protein n=1 Tax=Mesorhizobium sp. ZC-5 TaxID=2986066 RepID=UPI0021E76C62|nr:CDP-alcohol phosphatidyltransferase family protein [Mesorhizobium sp. ZC-5]MCV3240235.1 CDP-alcohol phosphatidyltransferase family protein [Mesorhizobium sp. ZC-5]